MSQNNQRYDLIKEIKLMLGDGMIDLELDPEHYELALTRALGRYRQRSTNSLEESFLFLDMQPGVQLYVLPKEVQDIQAIYRRVIGGAGGSTIDPFTLNFANTFYQMQNPGALGGTGAGTLATYDFALQYQSLAGRMFGRDLQFSWNTSSKKLLIHRVPPTKEEVALHIWNAKPECAIIEDVYARPWIRDYALASCKMMMGEARSKFQSLAGPQGGVSLNGTDLKSEATADFERLEKELVDLVDASDGYPFIIG